MARTELLHAVVLQTYDVGEADRFCILLTEEHGKITARAKGVRKLSSRMGGSILKGQQLILTVHQGHAGFLITGVKAVERPSIEDFSLPSFLEAEQGIELLLALLHDEEPLPEIFEGTVRFLQRCAENTAGQILPFTLLLLHFMGSLPSSRDEPFLSKGDETKLYIELSKRGRWNDLPALSIQEQRKLSTVCTDIVSQHISRPLRAMNVAQAMSK